MPLLRSLLSVRTGLVVALLFAGTLGAQDRRRETPRDTRRPAAEDLVRFATLAAGGETGEESEAEEGANNSADTRRGTEATRARATPTAGEKTSRTADTAPARAEAPVRALPVVLTLGDGRTVKGTARLAFPESISVRHVMEGVLYQKTIHVDQVQSIEIKRWKGRMVRERQDGQIFQFDGNRLELVLTSGQTLTLDGETLPFLAQFDLENRHGRVRMFTFWLDFLRQDGNWYTGMEGPSTGTRVVCHKDVVRKLTFHPDE